MKPHSNLSLAINLALIAAGMLMLAYASVPLYRLFCQATGFGGVAERTIKAAPGAGNRVITVEFDANVHPGLDWSFRPMVRQVNARVGQQMHIEYIAKNRGKTASAGTATFNITPVKAGSYFDKIQCFCFTRQTLKPGETKRLGVTFFIDPAINGDRQAGDIRTITLSYTFFWVEDKQMNR